MTGNPPEIWPDWPPPIPKLKPYRKEDRPMLFCIKGKPIAQARPKFARRGRFVTTYNPQATEAGLFVAKLLQQFQGRDMLEGPLRLKVVCYLPRPKGHFGTGRNAGCLKLSAPVFPTGKPDADNYLKFVADCLTGVVYRDDGQVVSAQAEKRYSTDPKTVIKIEPMAGRFARKEVEA